MAWYWLKNRMNKKQPNSLAEDYRNNSEHIFLILLTCVRISMFSSQIWKHDSLEDFFLGQTSKMEVLKFFQQLKSIINLSGAL